MKPLNKRKQNLSSAGEIINSCACRTHACACSVIFYDVLIDIHESLYRSALNMAVRGVEPTSVNNI